MADWDVMPPSAKGDASAEVLYTSVGEALTRWEHLEEELAEIFSVLVGAPELVPGRGPAIRAYGALGSFTTRATMLREAGAAFFEQFPAQAADAPRKGFEELIHKCEQFVARRNDIAHGKREIVPGRGHYLMPAFYNTKKHRPDKAMAFSYSSHQIRKYGNHFVDLRSLAKRVNLAISAMAMNAGSLNRSMP